MTRCALAGLVGAAVPGLGGGHLGGPINPRHPLIVASLAQTAQAAAHGNSASARAGATSPNVWRSAPRGPTRLTGCASTCTSGVDLRHRIGRLSRRGIECAPGMPSRSQAGTPVPVYVARDGPKRCVSPAELADGTLPYLAGSAHHRRFIEPPSPTRPPTRDSRSPGSSQWCPPLVSDDVDAAHGFAASALSFYETIPSYQKVIAREGVGEAATSLRSARRSRCAPVENATWRRVRRMSCSAR